MIPEDALHRLGELGVGQAIAERISHLSGIVPAAIAGKRSGRAVGVVDAQHLVLVAGLIVFVTNIDPFRIHQVAVAVHLLQIGEFVIAKILHGGRGQGTGGPGVRQMPGHIRRSRKDIHQRDKAIVACRAEHEAGIHPVLFIFDPLDIHGERAVDEDHGFPELPAVMDHPQQICFFLVEGQHGNAIRVQRIKVNTFPSVTGKQDNGHVIVLGCIGAFQRVGVKAGGRFAHSRTAPGRHRGADDAAVCICVPHGGIDLETGGLQGGIQFAAPVSVKAGVSGIGFIDGVVD